MLGEERKVKKAEVSNSNKSSNAEQILQTLSWSVDPISTPKTGLGLLALAVEMQDLSNDHPSSPTPHHTISKCVQLVS